MLVFALAVLAFHHARATKRQHLKTIQRAMILLFQQRRPHTDPEFIDLYPAALGRNKMSKLMHNNQHAKRQNRKYDLQQNTSPLTGQNKPALR